MRVTVVIRFGAAPDAACGTELMHPPIFFPFFVDMRFPSIERCGNMNGNICSVFEVNGTTDYSAQDRYG
ncbi:hypothetical protein DQG23_15555 [Paenibacillus contaminans]|uniref:Uncharacterized protein n=1 Tax=Paenibacillus contaminans TaxID=450362 RepID=A0A329ML81_9BACL|nr:hypothetical protein DQG23_15555 [Paenibacillus contaminans]